MANLSEDGDDPGELCGGGWRPLACWRAAVDDVIARLLFAAVVRFIEASD